MNDLLIKLKEIYYKAYNEALATGTPAPQALALADAMDKFINKNHKGVKGNIAVTPTLFMLADRFINGDIKFRGRDKK